MISVYVEYIEKISMNRYVLYNVVIVACKYSFSIGENLCFELGFTMLFLYYL